MLTLHEKMLILRRRANISQKQLAELVGASRTAVVYWEIGKYQPMATTILALANLYDVSIKYLLDDEMTDPAQDWEHELTKRARQLGKDEAMRRLGPIEKAKSDQI